jgi:hypothetical protein
MCLVHFCAFDLSMELAKKNWFPNSSDIYGNLIRGLKSIVLNIFTCKRVWEAIENINPQTIKAIQKIQIY